MIVVLFSRLMSWSKEKQIPAKFRKSFDLILLLKPHEIELKLSNFKSRDFFRSLKVVTPKIITLLRTSIDLYINQNALFYSVLFAFI